MVFMLRPRSSASQSVRNETYRLTPNVDLTEITDSFGNLCQRLVAPVGKFEVHAEAEVLVGAAKAPQPDAAFVPIPQLPDDTLIYLLPSRYCESDRFGDMALEVVEGCQPGYQQVAAISDWVRANVRNVPLSSTYPVSAVEVNARREGVCRDLAQLAMAMCRAICIPARMVVGYLHGLEPMDIHAWFEAFVGGQWWTFDPAAQDADAPRIAIARGRDSTDVAIYNQYGPLLLPTDMRVWVSAV